MGTTAMGKNAWCVFMLSCIRMIFTSWGRDHDKIENSKCTNFEQSKTQISTLPMNPFVINAQFLLYITMKYLIRFQMQIFTEI